MARFKTFEGDKVIITFGPELKEKPKRIAPAGPVHFVDSEEITLPKDGHISYAQLIGFLALRNEGHRVSKAREEVLSPAFFAHLDELGIKTVGAFIEDIVSKED